jgi:hypothetical protein
MKNVEPKVQPKGLESFSIAGVKVKISWKNYLSDTETAEAGELMAKIKDLRKKKLTHTHLGFKLCESYLDVAFNPLRRGSMSLYRVLQTHLECGKRTLLPESSEVACFSNILKYCRYF